MSTEVNKSQAEKLRKQILSVSNSNLSDDEFYERLKDDHYAMGVFQRLSGMGETPLGAKDELSFLDSLKKQDKAVPAEAENNTPQTPPVKRTAESISPLMPEQKQETPDWNKMTSFTQQQEPSVTTPAAPAKTSPTNFVERRADMPAKQDAVKQLQGEVEQLGVKKVESPLLADNLINDTKKKLEQWHLANDAFIREYEDKRSKTVQGMQEDQYLYTENFNPFKYLFNKDAKESEKYLNENSTRYHELIRQRDALNNTLYAVESMKQYADYDRSKAVGEDLSAMVDKGEITEDDMAALRGVSDEKEKEQVLSEMYRSGRISQDTMKKIQDLGDTSNKNGLLYGLFKTGHIEDFVSMGLTEISRNMDVLDVIRRKNNGIAISSDEETLLNVYGKLLELEGKERDFWFNAGTGMQQSLQFVLQTALTGGVGTAASAGKGVAQTMMKTLATNAVRQAVLTPLTPSMYEDYTRRLIGLEYLDDKVSGSDKAKELWKSYAGTFSERFSETLGGIVGDYNLFSKLVDNKFTRKLLGESFETMSKISNNAAYKTTADALRYAGVTDIPGEIASEFSGAIMNSILTMNSEELAQTFTLNFAGQVALQSVLMGGMGSVASYGIGSGYAAIESRRVRKQYEQSMTNLESAHFDNPSIEPLRKQLMEALDKKEIVDKDGKVENSNVTKILESIRDDYSRQKDHSENDVQAMRAVDNAVRSGVFRYGQDQAVMAIVEDHIGEYLNEDGNVYEVTDSQGTEYFMLDKTEDVVILINRATGEKVVKPNSDFGTGSVKRTSGSDFALNTFLLNIDKWNKEQPAAEAEIDSFIPADKVEMNGVVFDVAGYDPETNKYTIVDEQGRQTEVNADDEDIAPIYSNAVQEQQNAEEQAPEGTPQEAQPEVAETAEQNSVDNTDAGSDIESQGDQTEQVEQIKYDEEGNPVWLSASAERGKQEIDSAFEGDEAKAFVADKVKEAEKAVKKLESKKPKSTNIRDRKAEIEQIRVEKEQAMANLDYWNSMSQLYNAPVEEIIEPVAENENVVSPISEAVNSKVAEWSNLGVKINVANSVDDITNKKVAKDIKDGVPVAGWYDTSTGEVYVYAPNLTDTTEIDKTIIHEVVAHKGLRNLIGETEYQSFCERVFDMMPKELQDEYMAYPGVNGRKAAAADEYIAYLAEKEDLTAEEQALWDKLIQYFREMFDKALNGIVSKSNITNEDISKLIRMSYANIKNNAQQEADTTVESQSPNEEVADNGVVFENDTNGQAMYSIKTYREGGRDNLVNFAQKQVESNKLTQEQAEEIVFEMDSIYDMIQKYKDVYQPFGVWSEAEVKVDDNGKAVFSVVKPNGEYDMNLDFSLVCKKRRTLDSVFDEMIKRGIISEFELGQVDVAKINEIIREFGFETACRLCFVDAKRFRVAQVADQFCAKYNELVVMNDKQLKQVIKTEEKNSVRKKIAKHLLEHPEDKVILSRDNFMSANGFENIKVNKAAVMSLYNQAKGTGGPKASFGDVQYLNEIADSSWTPDKAYAVGGVRLQSFSDYVPRMVFDYIQMVADLAAKKLPVHSYTKESTFAKQFGLTGIKINMSLVPRVDADGVAPGLDKDGNYAWQEGETFPFDEAIAIQNAEGYKDNCGTIAVGISDEHILKMLDDENIRMVIPYHKSGLNKEVAKFNNIDQFVDYTNSQNTRYADGKKLNKADSKKHFNFNEDLHKNNDPRGAAQRYLEWCDEKGYIPKFEQFRNHPNYYKLLEDFTTVVTENGVDTVVPQKAVDMKFPKETDTFGSLETLIQQGLEEDAVLEGRRSEKIGEIVDKIEETLPKNNPTDPNDGPRYRTAEQKESLFEKAKEVFGTTNNFKVAGYMLPDGSLLDFSGRWEGGPGDARYTDHRAIGSGLYEASETDSNYDTNMYDFINQGAIRLMPESAGIYVSQPLTEKQEDRLANYIYRNNGEVILEIIDNDGNSISYIEYNRRTSPEKVLTDISNYFDKGVVPIQPEVRYRTSAEIDKEYPNWLEGTTNESGKHSTQVTKTVGTYNKVGEWIENNLGKDVEILDASSGMGLGTQSLREKGFNIEDVEPYQSEDRKQNNPATYSAYADIEKQYDYIISNAVLNVIPDDWRADVLHNMAARMKNGGKMFINTRKAGEEKSIKDKIELDTPQEVLVKRNGKIASYQKFFTPQELKTWVEQELGDGYTVEVANEENSGTKGLAAVVVTNTNPTDPNDDIRYRSAQPSFTDEENAIIEKAKEDGTYLKAPNGKDTNLTPKRWAQVRTNAFKEWFGDWENDPENASKVVDENGEPRVVYHGTGSKFYEFSYTNSANELGEGYYFTDSNDVALKYSKDTELEDNRIKIEELATDLFFEMGHTEDDIYDNEFVGDYNKAYDEAEKRLFGNGIVMPVFLNIRNPYELDDINPYNAAQLSRVYNNDGVIDTAFSERHKSIGNGVQYVVFKPNQIKSATENTGEFSSENDDIRYRIPSTPAEARQRAENIMKDAIAPMAAELGVEVNYVASEDISDVEPGARKKRQSKGWYQDGKVYINLSTHETIDDAKETYLHEVVGHYGLRGLLKDQFEPVMRKVFASLTPTQQQSLLEIFADEVEAAEEFLSSMAENDIEPSLVTKILAIIRDALRSMGINVDNYTNGDLEYLLWRSKNSLKENAGAVETAKQEAKDAEVRYRMVNRPAGYTTNKMAMTNKDKILHAVQDRMRPVKKIMDEIIARKGVLDETTDPYSQEFLATSRAAAEIDKFKEEQYAPLAEAIAEAMKVFTSQMNMTSEEARKAVDDYLYARHAPERNKQICVNEIYDTTLQGIAPKNAHLVDDAFKAEIRRMCADVYDNQFKGGKNMIRPNGLTSEQERVAISLARVMQKKALEISKETALDNATGQTVVIGNNRSGMTDQEAESIMRNVYNNATKVALDKVSEKVKGCTDFTLDKWFEYGLISQDDYNSYKAQYEYYIPLRGWDERGEDIDYMSIPTKQFNQASELISRNIKAKGRTSRASDPLAHIASLAQSACINGNKNLIRLHAFRMVEKNESKIADIAYIEKTFEIYDEEGNIIGYTKRAPSKKMFDQGRVKVIKDKDYKWHKTKSELAAHKVPVMIDGVAHTIYFKGEIGALAATAINGTDRDTRNIVTQTMSAGTRFISSNLTAKNIYFLAKNLVRDFGFGNFSYFIENGLYQTLKMNRNFITSMRTVSADARGKDMSTYIDGALYQEFKLNGGQTGFIQLDNLNKLSKQMDEMIANASANRGFISQGTYNTKKFIVDSFEILGEISENSMRFAVYKAERGRGMSPRQAAIAAKEVSVNFNRQGTKTKGFSAVYAFFNPAVQGAYSYAKFIQKNPIRFVEVAGAVTAIKFGLGMICELLSGGDDLPEGESAYDRLSDYVKATNFVIPLGAFSEDGEDKFLCIPLPSSLRGTTYIADVAVDMVFGRKDFGQAMKDYAMFNVGEFIPFDFDAIDLTGDNPMGTMIQAASPTILRPVVETVINRDFMGNPISKEPFVKSQDYLPQHKLAFNSTSPILVGTSKLLNEIGGGDEKRSAKYQISQNGQIEETGSSILDINPAKMEHLFKGYFGGMFEPWMDIWDTMRSATSKDIEIATDAMPLMNQFIKGPSSKPGYKKFYELRDEAQNIKDIINLYKEDYMNENYIPLNSNSFNIEIKTIYDIYSNLVSNYNETLMMMESNSGAIGTDKESIKEIEKQRDALILEAAVKYRDICDRRDKENKNN